MNASEVERGTVRSQRTYHGDRIASGSTAPAMCFSTKSRAKREIISKASTPPSPVTSRAKVRRSSTASGLGTAANTVSTWRLGGNSFNTAAVMIPNVPSAPM